VKASFRTKLEGLTERHAEIAQLLATPDAAEDPDQLRRLSQEYSQLEPVAEAWKAWHDNHAALEEARAMLEDDDADLRAMAEAEIESLTEQTEALEAELYRHLIPSDPHDNANVFLEIRAGTGGDEAAIFAGDLLRMYTRYAENQRWKLEILSASEGEHGGYREVIARLAGQGAYSRLKFESGAHRVQRVPETESQGRIHTSAATVAILPELEEVEMPEINPADLRVDTFRASGAGGQHINKTDSAVRLTHLPYRHRGRVPGRTLATQEPGQGAHLPGGAHLRDRARGPGGRAERRTQGSGRQRRPLRAHPHLQLPAGPGDRPSHQPDPVQAGTGDGR